MESKCCLHLQWTLKQLIFTSRKEELRSDSPWALQRMNSAISRLPVQEDTGVPAERWQMLFRLISIQPPALSSFTRGFLGLPASLQPPCRCFKQPIIGRAPREIILASFCLVIWGQENKLLPLFSPVPWQEMQPSSGTENKSRVGTNTGAS